MRIKLTQLAVVVAAAAGASTAAFALDPQDIRVSDGLMFTPTLKLKHGYDDNLHATESNEKSTWFTTLEPTFALNLDRAKSAYELKYRMSSKNYHSSKSSSHIDHHITAKSGFEFNSRNRLVLDAGYHKLESPNSDTEPTTGYIPNDKWHTKNVGGVYTFGARTARTQIDFAVNYDELRYDNSTKDPSTGERWNKDSERDAAFGRITGYYAVAPKTRLLLEGRYTDYDYISNDQRDSKNKALLAGVTWDATATTTGSVKIGRERKEYKNLSGQDNSTGMWEAGVTWAPRTYSTFRLNTRRGYDEGSIYEISDDSELGSDHVTSSIKTVDSSLGWKHYWTERLYSDAEYRRIDRDYQQADKRKDKIDQYALALTYEARRWLDIGLGYRHRDNDSNKSGRSYTRNIYTLTFNASL